MVETRPQDPSGTADARSDDLARRLEALSPEKRALLEAAFRERALKRGPATVARRVESGPAPLSFPQSRMWFLDQWQPGSPAHNGARALHIEGPLRTDLLRDALETVIERHESLRTVYVVENREPRQVPLESWSVDLPVIDLEPVSPDQRDAELRRGLRELAREPFDLERDVMIRGTLFRVAPESHVLLMRMHHIAADAASTRILFAELEELYAAKLEGRDASLPELTLQYADFAAWQRERLQGTFLEQLVEFWRNELEGAPRRLVLPTDHARPPVQRHEGAHRHFTLPLATADHVLQLSRSEGATPYMTMLAVFATLLYRFSGQDDIVIGTPIANRNHVELEPLVGFFTNTLVLRNRLGGNPTFRELLRRTRDTAVRAYDHQDLPFEKLVECLNVPRDPGYNPVFQVNFRAQAEPSPTLRLPGATTSIMELDIGFSRFDLALEFQFDHEGLNGYFEYDADLFESSTIEALLADLETLLARILANPDDSIVALAHHGGVGRRSSVSGRIRRGSRAAVIGSSHEDERP